MKEKIQINLTGEINLSGEAENAAYDPKYTHEQFRCECGSLNFEIFSRASAIWFVDIRCISCGKIFEAASE